MPSQGLIQPWGYYPLTWEEQHLPSRKGCIICLMVPRVNTKPMCCVFWICECMPNWSRYFQGLCLSSLYIYELPWKYIVILFHLITSHFTLSFCHQSFFHIDGSALLCVPRNLTAPKPSQATITHIPGSHWEWQLQTTMLPDSFMIVPRKLPYSCPSV